MTTPEEQQETKPFLSFEDHEELEREHEEAIANFDKKHGWKSTPSGNDNGKNKSSTKAQQPRPAKEEYIQKYSSWNTLIEAIIVENKPYFAVVDYAANITNFVMPTIKLQESFELDEKTLFRPESSSNRPYTFKSQKDFENCIAKASKETLDSLFNKVLVMWKKFIDADDYHLKICVADTMFTYKQDVIGTTHYLFFIADNDAGKSNNLTMFNFLAYRNMMSNNMTYANIYNFLGSRDEGVGTLCEDEADTIDEDHDRMGVYKEGYTKGHPVLRIVETVHGKKQVKFNTFCFKAFAGERLPDEVIGRGFLQRTIVLKCLPGFPDYDISEVADPAGDEEFQVLVDELNELRNVLFCYFRLLHYKDKIPNIKLSIRNREKQLFKPVLRLFQGTNTFQELIPVISKYISDRREGKVNSYHAFLFRLVRDLINSKGSLELESSTVWNFLKTNVEYKEIPFKPQSIETVEFGVLSQKGVIQTLKEVFQAAPPKYHSNSRKLIFSQKIIDRMTEVYDIDVEIMIQEGEDADAAALRTHRTDRTHVGLDRHMEGPGDSTDNSDSSHDENGVKASQDRPATDTKKASYASYVSYVSCGNGDGDGHKPRIYFSNGKYHCELCNDIGDRFYMEDHKCKGRKEDRN
jgi:hypothetical protein